MASEQEDSLKNLSKTLVEITRASSSAVRGLKTLEGALEGASNGAVDKATTKLIELAKQSSLLTSEMKDGIKDTKGAFAALSTISTVGTRVKELSKTLNETVGSQKDVKKATAAVHKELSALGIKISGNTDQLKKSLNSLVAEIDETAVQMGNTAKDLSSAGSKFGKALDDQRGAIAKSVATFATFSTALKFAKDAVIALYDTEIKLANRGLLAATNQSILTATKFNLSMEEVIDMFDKNRDTILSLGGGIDGVKKFQDQIEVASQGLEYLGKEGKKTAAQILSSFNRAGVSIETYTDNAKDINKQFRTLQATMGTTSEQFAEYYGEMFKSQSIQATLNLGDTKSANLMKQEIIARTANLTALGLTTQGMIELNKSQEALLNPQKNRQGEAIKQRQYAKMAVGTTAADMRAGGNNTDADTLEKGLADGSLDELLAGSKDSKHDELRKALAKMRDHNASVRGVSQGGDTSFNNMAGVHFSQLAGETLNNVQNQGSPLNAAALSHYNDPDGSKRKAALAGSGANEDGTNTEQTKRFAAERNVVENIQSLLTTPLGKAAAALASFTTAVLTAGGGLGGSGIGSLLGGLFGGAAGAGAVGAGAAAVTAGAATVGAVGAGLAVVGAPILGAGIAISNESNSKGGLTRRISDRNNRIDELKQLESNDPRNATKYAKERSGLESDRDSMQTKLSTLSGNSSGNPSGTSISNVLKTGPGFNEVKQSDGSTVRQEGSRNWRNNNPGNIEYGDFAKKHGAINSDGRFAIFPDYATGRAAKEALVFEDKNYKNLNLTDAITKYAPPTNKLGAFENDTAGYQRSALASVGGQNKKMSDYSSQERSSIMDAMQKVEGYKVGKTTLIDKGPLSIPGDVIPTAANTAGQVGPQTLAEAQLAATNLTNQLLAQGNAQNGKNTTKNDKRNAVQA
jgi:hypothetical protein